VNARRLWLLGTVPCRTGRCTATVHTADGGRTFTKTGAPPLPVEGYTPSIMFSGKQTGFAFVPDSRSPLYATHDGGATWQKQAIGDVLALATTPKTVYAVTARCSAQGCTHYRFRQAPQSSTAWRTTHLPFVPDGGLVALSARGVDVWLLGTPAGNRDPNDRLARSGDSGRTFTTGRGPCYSDLGGKLSPASVSVVWAVCPTGMLGGALRSTNGGLSFSHLHTPTLVNSAQLAAASDTMAVVFGNGAGSRLMRTTDGGASWKPAPTPETPVDIWSIAFTNSSVGFALVQTRRSAATLWTTGDGGAHWRALRVS
jgi:photosystem II stability/assembly factor-like uncharacterized protein